VSLRTLDRLREVLPATGPPTVDPRIQARRDEVSRARQRRRHRWIIGIGAVMALLLAAWGLTRSPLLAVDDISVDASAHLTADELRSQAGVRLGDHLVDIEPGVVRNRLLALPWVADATVDVDWTGTVRLSVTERVPVAAIADGAGGWILADAEGRAVTAVPAPADPGVVIVDGIAPVELGARFGSSLDAPLEVISALTPGLRTRVISVVPAADGTISLNVHPQGSVQLCQPDQLPAKIATMQTMFAQVDDTGLKTMYLCDPANPRIVR
jgi:cell division protein FtsQ